MLVGRDTERKQLEDIYQSDRNNMVVLYGRRGIGKSVIAQEFIQDKPAVYYKARECTEKEQLLLLARELKKFPEDILSMDFCYKELLKSIVLSLITDGRKAVIVMDEFHFVTAGSISFLEALSELMTSEKRVMLLFLSSSIHWVENCMVKELSTTAKCITSIIKLKELPFTDIVEYMPKSNIEQCVFCNASVGGVPKYLELWQDGKSFRDNIIRLFFKPDGALYLETEHFLKTELRELTAYNTILATIASGKIKLNDIFDHTGFSRAKISVYIKNLIQLDVVEKIFSYETGNRENILKGLYRIKDNYINFWYRFVYPNQSLIEQGKGKEVYEKCFLPSVSKYMRSYYSDVCLEFLKLLNQMKRLEAEYSNWGKWYGKDGILDVLAEDTNGNLIAAVCTFEDKPVGIDLFNSSKDLLKSAEIKVRELYLFAKNGFTRELNDLAGNVKGSSELKISLIELKDL